MTANPVRATSIAELDQLQARMVTDQERRDFFAFECRPDDIIITPYGKCGTTWLQQIVHCLRTRGDMNFDDISRVIPWIETASALGLDLNAEQVANPRCYKSHLPYDVIPKQGKYLLSIRDPVDAMISAYRFFEGWFFEPGSIDIEEFARERFLPSRNYWAHLRSWWQQRHNKQVMILVYENMLADIDTTVRRIAEFVDVPLDNKLLTTTLEYASREFMLLHKEKFSDPMMVALTESRCPLPPGSKSAKVTGGSIANISADLRQTFESVWCEEMAEETGFDNYADLAAALDS